MFIHCHFSIFVTIDFLFASQQFNFPLKLKIMLIKLIVLSLSFCYGYFQFFPDFLIADLLFFWNFKFFILLLLYWSLARVHFIIVLLRLTFLASWLLVLLFLLNNSLLPRSPFDLVLSFPFFFFFLDSLFLFLVPSLPLDFILFYVLGVWVYHAGDA